MANAIQELPASLLSRAVQSSPGCEYAWRLEDIPQVIETARFLNLVSVGGQLQFRLPDGTCECYWVEVNTYQSVDKTLPWSERVDSTAEVALRDFNALQQRYDFMAEGMVAFAPYLNALIEKGEEPAAFMCFVWYVLSEADEKAS